MLKNILKWARITSKQEGEQQFATQQMEYMGKVGDGIVAYPYGLFANIPADNLVLMGSVQGDADNRVAIGCALKDRPQLNSSEVALYHPPTGSVIKFTESGDLEIEAGGAVFNISGGTVNVTANLILTGNLNVLGTMTNNGQNVGNTHGHTQGNDSGGNIEAPIVGVT